ncbi:MAG TPA: acylphosphatase [Thermodesulfovibrionales bacterium]|nr:acylphosphatase [Thermodesulfovibrionales bacterium]
MNLARAHLYITGRVQGVSYRAFTRDLANQLGLRGWAKNLYDGSVEAVFEGDKKLIEEAVTRCQAGPPGARVDGVHVRWEDYQGDLKGFQIRYF